MFSILIPCLKREYLHSQLYWLSQQTFKDFTVVIMDGYYKEHCTQPFMQKSYPFQIIHVPLVENKLLAKRYDFSIRNNLAMLAPTFNFIFLSDTTYVPPTFAKKVNDSIMRSANSFGIFEVKHTTKYDAANHAVLPPDGPLVGCAYDYPIILNRRDFIYVLNGFDEVGSYSANVDFWFVVRCGGVGPMEILRPELLHVKHPETKFTWHRMPCEKCGPVFTEKAVRYANDWDDFFNHLRLDVDADLVKQMTYFDKDLGCMMWQCGNCGFGGAVSIGEYHKRVGANTQAPISGLDARAGRDLSKVYELMTAKCGNDVEAKLSFLKGSY